MLQEVQVCVNPRQLEPEGTSLPMLESGFCSMKWLGVLLSIPPAAIYRVPQGWKKT